MHEIPARTIQTDKTRVHSVRVQAAITGLHMLHPGYEHLFFDDRDADDFVATHYPEFKEAYRSFRFPIQRVDFFRYLAVHKLGGFYFDVDVYFARPLTPLLSHTCVFPVERLAWSRYLRRDRKLMVELGNYAFGAAPGHPFLAAIIDNCIRATRDHAWRDVVFAGMPRLLRRELFVIYTTGPGMVSRTFAELERTDSISLLHAGNPCDRASWNHFGDFAVHMMQSSWRHRLGAVRRRLLHWQQRRWEAEALRDAQRSGSPETRSVIRCDNEA
ncbi:MAG TPA: glycosyltransferase [Vicinamibacterales bacterium]